MDPRHTSQRIPSQAIYQEAQRAFHRFERAQATGKKNSDDGSYIVNRIEDGSNMNMASVFPISPINQLIPLLLKDKNTSRKLRIIDLGAGTAEYTDSLRNTFGDKVKVFSTGISKRPVNKYRDDFDLEKLHRNDIKWRSILELNDEPEFDLILSSYGEFYYGVKKNPLDADIKTQKEDPQRLYEKLEKIMTKLNDEGIASLSPIKNKKLLKQTLTRLSQEQGFDFDIKFKFTYEGGELWNRRYQAVIRKNAKLNFHKK